MKLQLRWTSKYGVVEKREEKQKVLTGCGGAYAAGFVLQKLGEVSAAVSRHN